MADLKLAVIAVRTIIQHLDRVPLLIGEITGERAQQQRLAHQAAQLSSHRRLSPN
jgi:hypothetical protein